MTIQTFSEQHRLKISRDECGDPIIAGRRGHLYFDGPQLCLMVTDGQPAQLSSWEALGGKLWLSDINYIAYDSRIQDVWVKGIPLENAQLAIRMCRIKRKFVMSPTQQANFTKAAEAGKSHRYGGQKPSLAPESIEQP